MVLPLWNTVWQVLKRLNIDLPYGLGIPVSSISPIIMKTNVHTQFLSIYLAILFTTVKVWKESKCPLTDK